MKITAFHRFQGWGLSTYARLVWRTAHYQVEGQEHVNQVHTAGSPLIIAAWHGMTMMLTGHIVAAEDPSQYVIIVPEDSRGATLSVWVRRMRATPFHISMKSESLVAARRLLALIRQMKQGKNLYVNPDGPYGPSREPKFGVAFIARKAGALIVPAGAFTATRLDIPRWDHYTVPFPFSRISVFLGEPLEVPPQVDLEQAQVMIQQELNKAEQSAKEMYYAGI